MRAAVLTISDRSARGEREDLSGPLIAETLEQQGWVITEQKIVSDEQGEIEATLREWVDQGSADLILTTGGTGFSPRDQAPEATREVVEKLAPGIVESMRAESLKKTPHAMLSRAVAGIRGQVLIVNLPGSPRAVQENLDVILRALPHAIQLLQDAPQSEKGHVYKDPDHKA